MAERSGTREKNNRAAAGAAGVLRKFLGKGITGPRDYYDYNLLAAVILLTCFGLVMLYSTSAYEAGIMYENDSFYFGKQAMISIGAIVAMVVGSQFDYHFYMRYSTALYIVSTVLLVLTRYIGVTINGARRWIFIGPFSFQSAELAKLAVILFLSSMIVSIGSKIKGVKAPLIVFAFGMFSAFCTYFFTENLSTAVIIAGICVIMIFIVHPRTGFFLALFAVGMALLLFFAVFIIPRITTQDSGSFRMRRILVWTNPEAYADEGGYQVMQGLYAIGSGGLFGKGLGNSTQKLEALPEAQNDMIFCIICEELGVFGALIVVFLFVFLLYRLFFIARNAPDLLGSLIATGIFAHIALQVVLNIAVVINFIPTTGITLPFVSYGGTSILFLMAEMMFALSISRQIRLS